MRRTLLLLTLAFLVAAPQAEAQDAKPQQKVAPGLLNLQPGGAGKAATTNGPYIDVLAEKYATVRDGRVAIDALPSGSPSALLADLERLGLQKGAIAGRLVSGLLPVDQIAALQDVSTLASARAAYAKTNVGAVTSQGDAAMNTDDVRATFGFDGTGITIGALSDSYDALGGAAADVASGDLPAGVNVLDDLPAGTDEGRAMLQLIHDVAPGADLAFHTAFGGIADFAQGIRDLRDAGSDVIVDDVIFFAEPMFTDGEIAQAVDEVVGDGVAYFSSAGNSGRDAYESPFVPSGVVLDTLPTLTPFGPPFFGGEAHDFDPGPGVDIVQDFTLGTGGEITVVYQWAQEYCSIHGVSGPADFDIYLVALDGGGNPLGVINGGVDVNDFCFTPLGFGDPVEITGFGWSGAPTTFGFMIVRYDASDPDTELPPTSKAVRFELGVSGVEFDTNSGTVYGHANAEGAHAIGAAAYFNTPAFGDDPALINDFSSAGPTDIYFDVAGNPIGPVTRMKPEVVGPDFTNTTFFISGFDIEGDGFPNFPGTSAAAPHVAGLAGLMLEADPTQTPGDIYGLLESTALDMDDPFTPGFDVGFDFGTGYGFVDALAVFDELVGPVECDDDFRITDFDADGVPDGEFIEFTNVGDDDASLAGCILLVFDPFTEDVTLLSTPPPLTIPAGGAVTFSPFAPSIPDGPGAFGLFNLTESEVSIGTDVTEVLGFQVAAVVYFDEDNLVGTFPADPSKAGDFVGAMRTLASAVAAGPTEGLPETFALGTNYPNPFNPATEIGFQLPEAAHVSLVVYDILGRPVATLVDGARDAGTHRVRFDASTLPSGTYLYRLEAGSFVDVKQMTLLK